MPDNMPVTREELIEQLNTLSRTVRIDEHRSAYVLPNPLRNALIAVLTEHPAGIAAAAKVDGEAARLLEQRLGFLTRLKEGTPRHTIDHPRASHYRAQRDALDAAIQALRQPFVPEPPSDEWARAIAALEPFAAFAEHTVDNEGWSGTAQRERIVDWFGPSEFRRAHAAIRALQAPKRDDSTIPVYEGD